MTPEGAEQRALEGRAFKFGDDISTDFIAASRYMHLRKNLPELAKHALEDADPTFVQRVKPGDFVVAGKNFGMGSSREQAPIVLKLNGVAAVIARSFARIFFRNAINIGLPVLICDTDRIRDGDQLRADLAGGVLVNQTTGETIPVSALPPVMLSIIGEGGIKPFIRAHGGLVSMSGGDPTQSGSQSDAASSFPCTLAEKIIGTGAGVPVRAGDLAVVDVDLVFVVDSSGPLAFKEMQGMGLERVARPEHSVVFIDHHAPSPRVELSQEQQFLRQCAGRYGMRLYDIGAGIGHQLVLEELAVPGTIAVGADSHSCTAGALCTFGTGMGASDVAVVLGTGQTWMRVPETIEVRLSGRTPRGVFAKDIVLELERRLGVDGATYRALEFTGEGTSALSVSERATLANMAVEMGGKAGLFPSDEQTRAWLDEHGRAKDWLPLSADPGASYLTTVEIDCSTLEPLVACPHQPDNVHPVSQLRGTRIDQVFIGTCTNARLDDLAVAARMLEGRKVHPRTRLIVVPASRRVMLEAMRLGYIQTLVEAGASVGVPSCGACFGMHMGVPGDGENVMSTQNRNFKGRMGNPNSSVYLGSPAVAAAAAITGEITDPRTL